MVHRLASQSFRHAFSTLLFPDSISACRRCLVFAVCPLCSEAMFIPSFTLFGATFLPIYNIPPNPRKVNKLRLSAEKLEFLRLLLKFLGLRLKFLTLNFGFVYYIT